MGRSLTCPPHSSGMCCIGCCKPGGGWSCLLGYTPLMPHPAAALATPHPFAPLNELDSHQLVGDPVPHQLGNTKVAGADVPDLQDKMQHSTGSG